LIDGVLADNALLGAFSEGLDQENALLRQVLVVTQEVFEVVAHLGTLFMVLVFGASDILDFFLAFNFGLFIPYELCS
jgi:hypothetical protein